MPPPSSSTKLKSNLDLLNECDNFPYLATQPTGSWSFIHASHTLGYIPRFIAERLHRDSLWDPDVFLVTPPPPANHARAPSSASSAEATAPPPTTTVELRGATLEERSLKLKAWLEKLRDEGVFEILSSCWRWEEYPVYVYGNGGSTDGEDGFGGKEMVVSMERAATPLFGVVTYGVHMTCYRYVEGGQLRLWTPTRAMDKKTYPGMMDNTVAGGVATGEGAMECLVREAAEEASLSETIVREKAKAVGTVTYFHVRDHRAGGETGLFQPECLYAFDLELPADVVPTPDDGEVHEFRLMSVEEVKRALAEGRFKPNCALVLLDFFIRHGILTPENEPDYVEIVSKLHRRLEFLLG